MSADGSTSMEKVICALKETFEGENKGVEVTCPPTGSSLAATPMLPAQPDILLILPDQGIVPLFSGAASAL